MPRSDAVDGICILPQTKTRLNRFQLRAIFYSGGRKEDIQTSTTHRPIYQKMADFTEYTGPSEEWLALEPNLPSPPKGQSIVELKEQLNKGEEDVSAKEMIDQGTTSVYSGVHYKIANVYAL